MVRLAMVCFLVSLPVAWAQNSGRIMVSGYAASSHPTLASRIAQALKDCRAQNGSCVIDAVDQTGLQDLGAFDPGAAAPGVTLYLGRGTYLADSITLRPGLRIVGLNEIDTVIQAKKSTTDLIVLPPGGPVHNVEIENMTLSGVEGGAQRAIYLNAQRSGPPAFHGGLWYSRFRNIRIYNFGGDNITIRGSQDEWWGPMQFLTWDHVMVFRPAKSERYALAISGETGQIRFLNCEFDNSGGAPPKPPRRGTGIFIGQEPGAKIWPINVQFELPTIQNWHKAVVVSHADNIHFITPHFEADDSLIDIVKGSRGIVAEAGIAWTNACQGGKARDGYCFYVDGSSAASIRDFSICCTPDQIIKAASGARVTSSSNTSWNKPARPDDVTSGEETILKGYSSPGGLCAPGQLYVDLNGDKGSTLYVCEGSRWKAH